MPTDIPVSLSLAECGAVALDRAAKDLCDASDAEAFLAALEGNLRLWSTLLGIARSLRWGETDARTAGFVVNTSRRAGRAVDDSHVDALVNINRSHCSRLAAGRDIEALRRRAMLAWKESGRCQQGLERWLIAEIERKARLH